ncbi:MAG: regulatory iron-sulfur-containing complex subunit RicT [Anaerolineae bacterium]|nr:regulatory iron-sulfur-containing complex subunit RicT [Anaerolineae bacterium]
MDKLVVGIRFQKIGKLYHFDASKYPEIRPGDFAIVNTSRGRQIGQVMGIINDPPKPLRGTWKRIERQATASDLMTRKHWEKKELEAMINCRAKAAEHDFEGLKVVKAEFTFDGELLTLLYNHEDEGEINLSALRKEMKECYPETKIEFRRVGPRDVAKIIGGMGACGLESRCCSTFLTEFSPISIKMAKAQGISLDPTEITGMCGRLRCCLIYEYEQYVEARKELPKRNKRVVTPMGEGKVIDILPLKESVVVLVDVEGERTRMEFLRHEIEPWDELEALRRKAEAPCDKHEGGGCDCGKADARKKESK